MESFSTGLLNQLEITSLFSHKKTARESQFRKHRGLHGVSTDTEVLEHCNESATDHQQVLSTEVLTKQQSKAHRRIRKILLTFSD